MRSRRTVLMALAAGVTLVLSHAVRAEDVLSEAPVTKPLRGQARVQITAEAAAAPAPEVPVAERRHQINVSVRRTDDDSVVSGPVTIKGVPMVASADVGDVDWEVAGSKVSGTVRHAANAVTAFEGTLTADGASGTFTMPNGARGEWSWDGPLPK